MPFGSTLFIWHHTGPWLASGSESNCSLAPEKQGFDAKCHLASPCSFGITLDHALPVVQSHTVPWPLRSESNCSLAPEKRGFDAKCHLAAPCLFGITLDHGLPVVQSQTVPWPLRSKDLMPNAIWHHHVHLASHWTMACQWFRVKLFPGP
jgi:hypothetical protein